MIKIFLVLSLCMLLTACPYFGDVIMPFCEIKNEYGRGVFLIKHKEGRIYHTIYLKKDESFIDVCEYGKLKKAEYFIYEDGEEQNLITHFSSDDLLKNNDCTLGFVGREF